jgi:hypothetical protein
MKSAPNLISYLHEFSQFFPHLVSIFLVQKSDLGGFQKLENGCRWSHLSVSAFRAEAHLSDPPLHLAPCTAPRSTGRGSARHACAAL